jgi:integrase
MNDRQIQLFTGVLKRIKPIKNQHKHEFKINCYHFFWNLFVYSLFLNRYETKPIDRSWVNVNLKRIFKAYGIAVEGIVSSHMFRKTLGNIVLKLNNYSNESIVLLMELFGHSSVALTKRYLGIREREILDVYDILHL